MEVVKQEDITILNTYEPNFGMPNFIYKEITLLQERHILVSIYYYSR